MAKETKFQVIKRTVEEEKNKKVRGEARLASLTDEKNRIFNSVEEEVGSPVYTVEEVEKICEELQKGITSDIEKMAEILREEGIEV